MKKRILYTILAILVLFSVAAVPEAAGDKHKLTIINETLEDIHVVLEGQGADPENYKITAKANKSYTKTVLEDTYHIVYKTCRAKGDWKGNIIDVDTNITIDDDMVIELQPCMGQPIQTKFTVNNHIDQEIVISLTSMNEEDLAHKDYELTTNLGRNRFEKIWSGQYAFTFDACDLTFSGILTIEKNGATQFTIKSCERFALEDFQAPVPVKVRIANHFSIPLDITLIGPVNYIKHLEPGMNRYNIVAGVYQYIYAAHGIRYEGIWVVPRSGTGYLGIPYFIPDLAD